MCVCVRVCVCVCECVSVCVCEHHVLRQDRNTIEDNQPLGDDALVQTTFCFLLTLTLAVTKLIP